MLKGRLQYIALPVFIVGVLLIVFFQFISGTSINSLIRGNERLLSELQLQTELQQLETDIVMLESDIRGAVITGDSMYLKNVKAQMNAINRRVQSIGTQLTDTTTAELMRQLAALVYSKIEHSNNVLTLLQQKGKEAAEEQINTNHGLLLRDRIVGYISALDKTRQSQVRSLIAKIELNGKRARNWGIIIALVAGGICAVAFWHFVSQSRRQQKLIQDLDASEKAVKEAARVKEQFLANMSHEIRTPMNAMLGFTSLLSDTKLDPDQRQYVHNIRASGENLLTIVNDILDLSKIEAGMMRIEMAPFDIHGLLHSVELMFRDKATQKGLYLRVDIDENLPSGLSGDSVRLTQILINLLGNAIKFTEAGSILLNVTMKRRVEDLVIVQFQVRDTGIGILPELQQTIFERFRQAEAETTRRYGGSGLGLAIVRDLVELQQGTITLESKPGKGSAFIIELPYLLVELEQSRELHTSQTNIDPELNIPARLLIAEDNSMNQQLMFHLMQRWGIEFDIVENGKEVIDTLRRSRYDLILMDIQMPVMDGYTATQHIRNELRSAVPVIAMTAHALAGEKEKCLSYGMNDYISKPIKEQELRRLILKYSERTSGEKNTDLIDLSYLRSLSDGNKTFEVNILNQFLQQMPEELSQLREHIYKEDAAGAAKLAHHMKSTVSYLGLSNELVPLLEEIEKQSGGNGSAQILLSCYEAVETTCKRALQEAEHILTTYEEKR